LTLLLSGFIEKQRYASQQPSLRGEAGAGRSVELARASDAGHIVDSTCDARQGQPRLHLMEVTRGQVGSVWAIQQWKRPCPTCRCGSLLDELQKWFASLKAKVSAKS
jgi:hypothetical protein